MNVPDDLKYTDSHEWVRIDGDVATIGVTDFAQQELTELVYVELPEVGRAVSAGDEVAVVESVKSASDIYAPVSGEVVEVNESLSDDPSAVNNAPYDDGWILKIRLSNPSETDALLSPEAYREKISG